MKIFLLTRQWQDKPAGIELHYWGVSNSITVKITISGMPCVCFLSRNQDLDQQLLSLVKSRKQVELTNFEGQMVDAIYFSHQYKLRQFSKYANQRAIPLYESDVKPSDRFLMERFITSSCDVIGESRLDDHGIHHFINPKLKPTEYKANIKWLSIDIETDITATQLFSIAVYGENDSHVFMLSEQEIDEKPEFSWSIHVSEKELLMSFFIWIQAYDPELIIGWNIVGFDLIVLEKKCQQLGLQLNIGQQNSAATIFKSRNVGEMNLAQLQGRVVMDGIEMLRAAFWSFESFALDNVAHELLGKNKLITGADKPGQIKRLFHTDKVQLARYNLEDCRLVAEIFKFTGLIDFAIERASMTGLAFGRVGGSVAAFDNLYLPRLHRSGVVAPDVGSQVSTIASPGGYVIDSQPGLYADVLLFDFKSLYPSIIRTFRIDPLGLVKPGANPVSGFLDATFSRSTSILPDLIAQLWMRRDLAKEQNNQPLSQAVKIIMNSFYGVLGTDGCRFYDPKLASSITRRGHEIIQKTQLFIEERGFQVIYGDTDSIFVLLENCKGQDQAQLIGHDLVKQLNDFWNQKIKNEFDLPSFLEVEFETHFKRFYMPTVRGSELGSKKRYAGWIESKQGVPQLVIKGLEAVRTDWTAFARQSQTQVLNLLFTDQPVAAYVLELAKGLLDGQFDDQLIYTKRLRKPLESYVKNVPPHVQAARKMDDPGRKINYMITLNGAEPVENLTAKADYAHYLERQLKPAVEGLLQCIGLDFDEIVNSQMRLF